MKKKAKKKEKPNPNEVPKLIPEQILETVSNAFFELKKVQGDDFYFVVSTRNKINEEGRYLYRIVYRKKMLAENDLLKLKRVSKYSVSKMKPLDLTDLKKLH